MKTLLPSFMAPRSPLLTKNCYLDGKMENLIEQAHLMMATSLYKLELFVVVLLLYLLISGGSFSYSILLYSHTLSAIIGLYFWEWRRKHTVALYSVQFETGVKGAGRRWIRADVVRLDYRSISCHAWRDDTMVFHWIFQFSNFIVSGSIYLSSINLLESKK